MQFDTHVNLLTGTILAPPGDPLNGTDFELHPGDGDRFEANMPVVLVPPDSIATFDNAEIGYLTNVTGDTLTIERGQEGTFKKAVASGWIVDATLTAKLLTDVEEAVQAASGSAMTAPSPPIESLNGSRTTFSVSSAFTAGHLWVTLNGLLEPVTEVGDTQFSFADPPVSGDAILVWYVPVA